MALIAAHRNAGVTFSYCGHCLVTLSLTINTALERLSALSTPTQESHSPLYSLPLPKLSGISVPAGTSSETTRS